MKKIVLEYQCQYNPLKIDWKKTRKRVFKILKPFLIEINNIRKRNKWKRFELIDRNLLIYYLKEKFEMSKRSYIFLFRLFCSLGLMKYKSSIILKHKFYEVIK